MSRRRPQRATIVDIARAAGVSVSTVSRVLREHVDVGSETRAKVKASIATLGYRPSPIARALVSGESRLLALLVSDITNPFYPQLAKSVEQEAAKAGYTVVICNTADRTAETRRHLTRLLGQGLDGVIHASVGQDETALLAVLGDRRRVVFTNRAPTSGAVSYVVSDNAAGAAALTRHLLSRGHRRIGFIGGPAYARNATERLQGFRQAMGEVPEAEALVVEGEFSMDSGRQATLRWLDEGRGLTAVIAVNDSVATGAMEILMQRGQRVPDDIALAGFDGTHVAALPMMSLTTVDQHSDEMGRRAVRVLVRQLRGSGRFVPTRQVLPTELLLRASTEGPRRTLPTTLMAPGSVSGAAETKVIAR